MWPNVNEESHEECAYRVWEQSDLRFVCKNAITLTHCGRVTHICVGKLTIIGSDTGLSPSRRQAIIRTNTGILLIRTLGTNFSEILMHLKMSSGKMAVFLFRSQCVKSVEDDPDSKVMMGPTWGLPGSYRPHMGPMLAIWTLLSGEGWPPPRDPINTHTSIGSIKSSLLNKWHYSKWPSTPWNLAALRVVSIRANFFLVNTPFTNKN